MKKIKLKRLINKYKYLILIILGIILLVLLFNIYRIKTAKVNVVLIDDLDITVYEKLKVSNLITSINGKLTEDFEINTNKLGKQTITIKFINDDNIKVKYSFNIKVVDDIDPLIWLSGSKSYPVGSKDTLKDDIMCGDNYDDNPKCKIIGDYDLNVVGTYPLTYIATDSNKNKSTIDFNLYVYEPKKSSGTSSSSNELNGTDYKEVVKEYKSGKTKIGIDISKWQGKVDFKKIKKAGVEFVIIRVGGTRGVDGEYFVDEQFKRNIKEANKYNIPVGVYFYSYSNSYEKAKKDAKWVLKQIKGYDVELGVAYDFEDYNNFNSYNMSFYKMSMIANAFLNTIKDKNYKTMLYGSKNYLESIWMNNEHNTWLAHYTISTNYEGKYKYWQLTDDGVIDGINNYVDIDIMYK